MVKQAIANSAIKLRDWSIVEQGAGKFNFEGFYEQMMDLTKVPKAQVYPYNLNLTRTSDYFLPFSRQVMYSSMQPFSIEFSVSNWKSPHSRIPHRPEFTVFSENLDLVALNCIQLEFSYKEIFWPFFGSIQVILHSPDTLACRALSAEAVVITV